MIVSNDARNIVSARNHRGVVTVVPLTSSDRPAHNFQTRIYAGADNGLTVDSTAQAEQIRAVDYSRFARQLGTITWEDRAAIDNAIMVHLDL